MFQKPQIHTFLEKTWFHWQGFEVHAVYPFLTAASTLNKIAAV